MQAPVVYGVLAVHLYDLIMSVTLDMNVSNVVPYSITSVGHGPHPGFLAVSPHVALVINPVVGCRYFPPGLL